MKAFLENPKELRIGDKTISVLSSFIEFRDKKEIWEVIVFSDVTAAKLDAVMKLANAAAHELRQPLTIIVGAVSLLGEELSDIKHVGKYLTMLEESCYRLNDIIKKIGDITAYRIKQYTEDVSILDIEGSSQKDAR
jgi:signal transduction histidine kinase